MQSMVKNSLIFKALNSKTYLLLKGKPHQLHKRMNELHTRHVEVKDYIKWVPKIVSLI